MTEDESFVVVSKKQNNKKQDEISSKLNEKLQFTEADLSNKIQDLTNNRNNFNSSDNSFNTKSNTYIKSNLDVDASYSLKSLARSKCSFQKNKGMCFSFQNYLKRLFVSSW